MNKVNYIFLTRPNFSLRSVLSDFGTDQRPIATMCREWQPIAGAENLGGCKKLVSSFRFATFANDF